MPLSPNEAADALKDLSSTERRSASAYGYHTASPHLILWGFIWIAEYGGFYFFPHRPAIFPLLSVAGIFGSYIIGRRMKGAASTNFSWRYFATFVAIFAFVGALFIVMPPTRDAQLVAFFPLLVALAYVLMGIWRGLVRIGVVGVAIGVLTLVGYFYLQPYFLPWIAAVGGGALLLGGLWLRRV